ncbi:MAG: GspH/FimT family pseudopilin [Rhodoferax sp.]
MSYCLKSRSSAVLGNALLFRSRVRKWAGFSLVELMVVVAIAAVLAAVAVPSITSMLQKNRLSSAASALQVSLSLARSEAIKHGIDAKVTVAANGAAGVWTNGWTVFLDKTNDANAGLAPTVDTTGATAVTRLEVAAAPSGPVSFAQTGSLNYFIYNGQGRVVDINGGPGNRSVWFYDGSSDKYCLVISIGGRVRAARVGSSQSCPTS